MKVLVTGITGQLGYDLCRIMKGKEEVIGVSRKNFDLIDTKKTYNFIKNTKPDVVIHCAAYTKVDECEKNADLAFKINSVGTANIASACNDIGAKMVYISTDYVFDGEKGEPYLEFDQPNPINVYGKSKLAGENLVKEIVNKHFIVRTSWLYGENGNNFVRTILKLAEEKKMLRIVNDQFGTPTYTKDLAEAIYNLIKSNYYGTYHISNNGQTTWFYYAKTILELMCISVKIEPIYSEDYPSPAKRPKFSVLRNFMLESRLGIKMRCWENALEDFIKNLKDKRD